MEAQIFQVVLMGCLKNEHVQNAKRNCSPHIKSRVIHGNMQIKLIFEKTIKMLKPTIHLFMNPLCPSQRKKTQRRCQEDETTAPLKFVFNKWTFSNFEIKI